MSGGEIISSGLRSGQVLGLTGYLDHAVRVPVVQTERESAFRLGVEGWAA